MQTLTKTVTDGRFTLHYRLTKMGEDLVLLVGGGEEHVGSIVLALSRPSLADPSRPATTVSILNVMGHKDESVARPLAEALCLATGRPVVVVAGIHYDNLTPAEIQKILELNGQAVLALPDWVAALG